MKPNRDPAELTLSISGQSRSGDAARALRDRPPDDPSGLTERVQATRADLNDAAIAASAAQNAWPQTLPRKPPASLYQAVEIIDARVIGLVDRLIAESSASRFKAKDTPPP
jgi:acyl-CoA reductase-like NAD-dependent aldehyde dehydrogenase